MKPSLKRLLWFGLPCLAGWFAASHYLSGAGSLAFHAAVAEARLAIGVGSGAAGSTPLEAEFTALLKAEDGERISELKALLEKIRTCTDARVLRRLYAALKDRGLNADLLATALQRRLVELDPDATILMAVRDRSRFAEGWTTAICKGWAEFQTDERLTEVMRGLAGDMERLRGQFSGNTAWMGAMAEKFGRLLGPERVLRVGLASGFQAFSEPYEAIFRDAAKTNPALVEAELAKITDPKLRAAAQNGWLQGLSVSQPARVLAILAAGEPKVEARDSTRLLREIAKNDPAAVRKYLETNPAAMGNQALVSTLAGQMSKDPQAAVWAEDHLEGRARRNFLSGLFRSQARSAPEHAAATLALLPVGSRKSTLEELARSQRFTRDLPDSFWDAYPGYEKLWDTTPKPEKPTPPVAWPATPDAAAQALTTAPGNQFRQMLRSYADHDPAFAMELLTQPQVAEKFQGRAYSMLVAGRYVSENEGTFAVMDQWMKSDPVAASTWVADHPGRAAGYALAAMPHLADTDPARAQAFANRLTEPRTKAEALRILDRRQRLNER